MREQPGTVAARHRDAHTRGEKARTGVLARIYRIAHIDVGKARVAHRTHGSHAACELLLCVLLDDASQIPHADGVSHHLVDKIARRTCARRLAGPAKMHVQVHKAGRKVSSPKIDFLRIRRWHDFLCRTDRRDAALVADDNSGIGTRLHVGGAVKDGCVGENVGHEILLKRALN